MGRAGKLFVTLIAKHSLQDIGTHMPVILDARRQELDRLMVSAAAGHMMFAYRDFLHELLCETPETVVRSLLSNSRATPITLVDPDGLQSLLRRAPALPETTGVPPTDFHAGALALIRDGIQAAVDPDATDAIRSEVEAAYLHDIRRDLLSVMPDAAIVAALIDPASRVTNELVRFADDDVEQMMDAFADDIRDYRRTTVRKVLALRWPDALVSLDHVEALANDHADIRDKLNFVYREGGTAQLSAIVRAAEPILIKQGVMLDGKAFLSHYIAIDAASLVATESESMRRYRRLDSVVDGLAPVRDHADQDIRILANKAINDAAFLDDFNEDLTAALFRNDTAAVSGVLAQRYGKRQYATAAQSVADIACAAMHEVTPDSPDKVMGL